MFSSIDSIEMSTEDTKQSKTKSKTTPTTKKKKADDSTNKSIIVIFYGGYSIDKAPYTQPNHLTVLERSCKSMLTMDAKSRVKYAKNLLQTFYWYHDSAATTMMAHLYMKDTKQCRVVPDDFLQRICCHEWIEEVCRLLKHIIEATILKEPNSKETLEKLADAESLSFLKTYFIRVATVDFLDAIESEDARSLSSLILEKCFKTQRKFLLIDERIVSVLLKRLQQHFEAMVRTLNKRAEKRKRDESTTAAAVAEQDSALKTTKKKKKKQQQQDKTDGAEAMDVDTNKTPNDANDEDRKKKKKTTSNTNAKEGRDSPQSMEVDEAAENQEPKKKKQKTNSSNATAAVGGENKKKSANAKTGKITAAASVTLYDQRQMSAHSEKVLNQVAEPTSISTVQDAMALSVVKEPLYGTSGVSYEEMDPFIEEAILDDPNSNVWEDPVNAVRVLVQFGGFQRWLTRALAQLFQAQRISAANCINKLWSSSIEMRTIRKRMFVYYAKLVSAVRKMDTTSLFVDGATMSQLLVKTPTTRFFKIIPLEKTNGRRYERKFDTREHTNDSRFVSTDRIASFGTQVDSCCFKNSEPQRVSSTDASGCICARCGRIYYN